MAPTPSSLRSKQAHLTILRTPISKHRLNFPSATMKTPNVDLAAKDHAPAEHPVEVVGRIRDYPDGREKPASILQVNPDNQTIRVRADIGYRDFTLDGVSLSENEDLEGFYSKFIEERIKGVRVGNKCTIMMYGPTGSGKSHTMFGCGKQPGIVYQALKNILGDGTQDGQALEGIGMFVQVTVLEIYNEEIYDLLSSSNGSGFGFGWPKAGNGLKARLEVMGRKAKNASFISGTEAARISKEIQKVEKRRIVKSTHCNERSSRSHCMIIIDVPTVGGRLMLVDMAGSENIEQAGQIGFEAKMQTAKINQGNIALKRVVESIANGDSHVPFRDSKLTMLLQDSFEDDKSKILMILCASPDHKELHKTICTLEYGAKAKCIVRGPHTPNKDKNGADNTSSAVILGSRIAAMDQFINKLQMENKQREKERNEAHKQLVKKEEEVANLRALLEQKGTPPVSSEEDIDVKVNERTKSLKLELERKLEECRRMAEEFVEIERRRMEERILQQQEEVEMLTRRLEEIESDFRRSKDEKGDLNSSKDLDESSGFAKRLASLYSDEDPGMVKSMDLDMGDQEPYIPEIKHTNESIAPRGCLSTVFEEDENEEEEEEDEEKVIVEDKRVCSSTVVPQKMELTTNVLGEELVKNGEETASARLLRIQNIFTLCGNQRELSQHKHPSEKTSCIQSSPVASKDKENDHYYPLSPPKMTNLDHKILLTPISCSSLNQLGDGLSPELAVTPFVTLRRP